MSKKRDRAEDAADAAIYLARKAALGAHDTLPEEVSTGVLRGEKARGAIRKWRGLSQVALAEQIGLTPSELSDIEDGKCDPSKEVAEKLAKALDVPVEWIGYQQLTSRSC